MKSETMTITPEQAKQWISNQGYNRKLSPKHVKYLADEIKQGRWRVTHQGIAFGDNGKLIDGQHRLQAIIESGIAVQMQVTFGVPVGQFTILDRGMPRDMSTITGIPAFNTEIYGFMIEIAYAHASKVNPDSVFKLNQYLSPSVDELHNSSNTGIRYYSSSPIRTGAIMNLQKANDKQYILDLYRNLVLQKYDELPPVAQALCRMHTREIKESFSLSGWTVRLKTFARSMYVFDKSNSTKSQIIVTDVMKESYLKETADFVQSMIGGKSDFAKERALQKIVEAKEKELKALRTKVMKARSNAIDHQNNQLSLEASS